MKIHQPHDKLAKNFLSNLEVARDFLQSHLPAHIRNRCDFRSLRIESSSFIDEDLRQHVSDILYSLKIDEQPGLIYCVVEAQVIPKKLMPFRMVRYQVAGLKEYTKSHKDGPLPVIIPIVLYTGKQSPYPFSMDFYDCFANPELARETFLNPNLIDLSVTPDDEIKKHGQAAFLEIVSKHIRDRDVFNLARSLAELLKIYQITGDLYLHMLQYITKCGQCENFDEFIKILIEEVPVQYKEATMTIAEQLENRGYHKGKLEEAVTIAKNMLSEGLDQALVKKVTGLSDADLSELKQTH